jgi:hypothetical protein
VVTDCEEINCVTYVIEGLLELLVGSRDVNKAEEKIVVSDSV